MSTSFLTGQRLTADLLNANVTAFMPATYVKSAATDRASTVTFTDDPELASIPLSVGTWEIVFEAMWTQANAAADIATMWAFTGTAGVSRRKCLGTSLAATGGPSAFTETVFGGFDTNTAAQYGTGTSAGYSVFRESVDNYVVTVAGNFSIQWAQVVSTAANTTLRPGSSVTVRKIS